MTTNQIYTAFDGTKFDDKAECINYETDKVWDFLRKVRYKSYYSNKLFSLKKDWIFYSFLDEREKAKSPIGYDCDIKKMDLDFDEFINDTCFLSFKGLSPEQKLYTLSWIKSLDDFIECGHFYDFKEENIKNIEQWYRWIDPETEQHEWVDIQSVINEKEKDLKELMALKAIEEGE